MEHPGEKLWTEDRTCVRVAEKREKESKKGTPDGTMDGREDTEAEANRGSKLH